MTLSQQDKDVLTQNWAEARQQVVQQFPNAGLEETEGDNPGDPSQIANDIAARTGTDVNDVEKAMQQIAKQYAMKNSKNA